MPQFTRRALLRLAAIAGPGSAVASGAAATTPGDADGLPDAIPDDWRSLEVRTLAKTQEAPVERASDPTFLERWRRRSRANAAEYAERVTAEPGWRSHANAAPAWTGRCTGDPDLYPDVDARDFYGTAGRRRRVAFYDRTGARLSGHLWTPVADARDGTPSSEGLPGVVITNGAIDAPETLYWWAAQALAEAGYVVLTYDLRGQGRSDAGPAGGDRTAAADDGAGSGSVFLADQVDAVDFLRSTPESPHGPTAGRDRGDGAPVETYDPVFDRLDRDRVGLAAHGLGAAAASALQGIDWPTGGENPVDALVAWDDLLPAGEAFGGVRVDPSVPAMGQSGDYGAAPAPNRRRPDPDARLGAFEGWREVGLPAGQVVVYGGTHFEWARTPTYPATARTFGNALAEHYTVAWFDRWLKRPGESGHVDAVDRLLDDDAWGHALSLRHRSARAFPDRDGVWHTCEDVRAASGAPTRR